MLVREVMSTEPVTVRAETHAKAALRLLDEHSITMMPVVAESRRVVGVLSEADLIRERVLSDARSTMMPPDPASTEGVNETVGGLMSRRAITVTGQTDLAEAVELMTSTGIKSLPVVDEDGRLAGVVSRRDIVHALARSDEHVERDLDALLQSLGTTWLVTCEDGTVTITGPVGDKNRALALAAASTVPGVVHVHFG
jgi:CBS-domain-containing membrane protein